MQSTGLRAHVSASRQRDPRRFVQDDTIREAILPVAQLIPGQKLASATSHDKSKRFAAFFPAHQ